MSVHQDFLVLLLVGILGAWSVRAMLGAGFYPMHDDTQVARVVVMGRALREGQFPVRMVSDLGYGYGYPIFNFYAPLPYYIGGMIYLWGASGLLATKMLVVLGQMLSGITMYVLMRKYYHWAGAFASSALYIFAPYHAVDWFVRGAYGEAWLLVFLPMVLYGIIEYWNNEEVLMPAIIGALGLVGSLLSHTTLGITVYGLSVIGVTLMTVLKMYFHMISKRSIYYIVCLLVFSIGLSAFFWIPMISEMSFTAVSGQLGGGADIYSNFVCIYQLWDSPWGFGGSGNTCDNDGMSFRLGKTHIIAALFGGAYLFWKKKEKSNQILIVLMTTLFAIAIFMMLPISTNLWSVLMQLAYIQYPWRFLTLAAVALSVLGGASVLWAKKYSPIILGICIIFLLYTSGKIFVPQYLYLKEDAEFELSEELKYRASKVSDEYLSFDVPRPQNTQDVVGDAIGSTDSMQVKKIVSSAVYEKYSVKPVSRQRIVIKKFAFPGWVVLLDGVETKYSIDKGLIVVDVPQSASKVELIFKNTPVRTLGNLISCISLLYIFYFIFGYGKKNIN